jgi:hypothetical protein
MGDFHGQLNAVMHESAVLQQQCNLQSVVKSKCKRRPHRHESRLEYWHSQSRMYKRS